MDRATYGLIKSSSFYLVALKFQIIFFLNLMVYVSTMSVLIREHSDTWKGVRI